MIAKSIVAADAAFADCEFQCFCSLDMLSANPLRIAAGSLVASLRQQGRGSEVHRVINERVIRSILFPSCLWCAAGLSPGRYMVDGDSCIIIVFAATGFKLPRDRSICCAYDLVCTHNGCNNPLWVATLSWQKNYNKLGSSYRCAMMCIQLPACRVY